MKLEEIDNLLSHAITCIQIPDLSNLLFDGKGEIELNRRLSIAIENCGYSSRVEVSVPRAKGARTHSDIVLFDSLKQEVIACIECKSCITPDVYKRAKPNNNFNRIKDDVEKYAVHNYSPLYTVMWAIHWDDFPKEDSSCLEQFKYFDMHKKMHVSGFLIKELQDSIRDALFQVGLGYPIHQSIIGPFDQWRGCRASLIATLSRVL